MVASRPLLLGTNVPGMLSVVHGAPSVHPDELSAWIDDARRVERAHRVTVAWLRSRLPGYPLLPAPQLAPGTPLTTEEFTHRLSWARDERRAGFQFQDPPTEPLDALGATKDSARASEATRRLAFALAGTAPWQRFHIADAALSPSDRTKLLAARKAVADASMQTAVDSHEPDFAVQRDAYRQQVVNDAISALTGPAREYADAFDAADRLLELACSDIFGQLAVYRTVVLRSVSNLSSHGAGMGTVTFTVEAAVHLDAGAVVWLDDPLVEDPVQLTSVNYSVDQAVGTKVVAWGRVLLGAAAVLDRPAP